MGAWGTGAYENDTALDWASETGAGLESIEAAIDAVIKTSTNAYLDADVGCIGVAACEALYGYHNPRPSLLGKLFGRTKKPKKQSALIHKACAALERVTKGKSELAELWAETEDKGEGWRRSISELCQRLESIPE